MCNSYFSYFSEPSSNIIWLITYLKLNFRTLRKIPLNNPWRIPHLWRQILHGSRIPILTRHRRRKHQKQKRQTTRKIMINVQHVRNYTQSRRRYVKGTNRYTTFTRLWRKSANTYPHKIDRKLQLSVMQKSAHATIAENQGISHATAEHTIQPESAKHAKSALTQQRFNPNPTFNQSKNNNSSSQNNTRCNDGQQRRPDNNQRPTFWNTHPSFQNNRQFPNTSNRTRKQRHNSRQQQDFRPQKPQTKESKSSHDSCHRTTYKETAHHSERNSLPNSTSAEREDTENKRPSLRTFTGNGRKSICSALRNIA